MRKKFNLLQQYQNSEARENYALIYETNCHLKHVFHHEYERDFWDSIEFWIPWNLDSMIRFQKKSFREKGFHN